MRAPSDLHEIRMNLYIRQEHSRESTVHQCYRNFIMTGLKASK